jgi:hypothetical protein
MQYLLRNSKQNTGQNTNWVVNTLLIILGFAIYYWALSTFYAVCNAGVRFDADEEAATPGFIFLFGNFGHLDMLVITLAVITSSTSFSYGITNLSTNFLQLPIYYFKYAKLILGLLLMGVFIYAGFLVFNIPVIMSQFGFTFTATDGTAATAGMYYVQIQLFLILLPVSLLTAFLCHMFTKPNVMLQYTLVLYMLLALVGMVVGLATTNNYYLLAFALVLIVIMGLYFFVSKTKIRL